MVKYLSLQPIFGWQENIKNKKIKNKKNPESK